MLETAIIAFREGMEAFLIVAITLAYLARTGREHLKKPVYAGIVAALACSAVLGVWLEDISDNPLTEGVLAVVAGILVGTFTIHMIKAAKTMGRDIRDKIDAHASKTGLWAGLGIFLFTTLMITREGMETVLMMSAAAYQTTAAQMFAGILAGLALAALMGYFWVRKSHLTNIGRFLTVSSIFLVLFSFHLFLYGLHELSETGMVPLLDNGVFHELTEGLSHDSMASQIITASLVLVPLGWLCVAVIRDKFERKSIGAAAE
jgi:high-affinity iron transporter